MTDGTLPTPADRYIIDLDVPAFAVWERVEEYADAPLTNLLTLHQPIARLTVGLIAVEIERRYGLDWEDAIEHARKTTGEQVTWRTDPPPKARPETGFSTMVPPLEPETEPDSGTSPASAPPSDPSPASPSATGSDDSGSDANSTDNAEPA